MCRNAPPSVHHSLTIARPERAAPRGFARRAGLGADPGHVDVLHAVPQPRRGVGQGRTDQLVLRRDGRDPMRIVRRRSRGGAGASIPRPPRARIDLDAGVRVWFGSSRFRLRRVWTRHCRCAALGARLPARPAGLCPRCFLSLVRHASADSASSRRSHLSAEPNVGRRRRANRASVRGNLSHVSPRP